MKRGEIRISSCSDLNKKKNRVVIYYDGKEEKDGVICWLVGKQLWRNFAYIKDFIKKVYDIKWDHTVLERKKTC